MATRYGTLDIYTDARFSADDIYREAKRTYGELVADFATAVAELDDFDKLTSALSACGLPRIDADNVPSADVYVPLPGVASVALSMRYPFLLSRFPKNDNDVSMFSHTHYDEIPSGWAARFGLEMLEDIRTIILGDNPTAQQIAYFEGYRVEQVKEKFGSLHWYDAGGNDKKTYEALYNLVDLYEELSAATCIQCGNIEAVLTDTGGYILPVCMKCRKRSLTDHSRSLTEVDEFAHAHGFTGRWVGYNTASAIRTYLAASGTAHATSLLEDYTVVHYTADEQVEKNVYDELHAAYPDLHVFALAAEYKCAAKVSVEVPTLQEVEEMLIAASA